jgi:hypothetical protein
MVDTQMQIHGINLDMLTNQPVIILKDMENKRYLPIWIGQYEATAILMELQGIEAARPLTHDLLKNLIDQLHVKLDKIVIDDIEDGTFFAKMYIHNSNKIEKIDARPSDAIALAVRLKAPIFAAEKVVEKATVSSELGEEDEVQRFREFLDEINPEDFKDK